MASVFETSGTFKIQRLRTENPSFLSGAIATGGPLPVPVAVATGPQVISGAAPGNDELWLVAVTVPAAPEVVWVQVSSDYFVWADTGNLLQNSYLYTFGDITDGGNTRGPVAGIGDSMAYSLAADPGVTAKWAYPYPPSVPRAPGQWVLTADGWTMVVSTKVGSAAPTGANDMRLDLSQVILIGYPVNAWGTSAIWTQTGSRGS
jgi:hypothetical protein